VRFDTNVTAVRRFFRVPRSTSFFRVRTASFSAAFVRPFRLFSLSKSFHGLATIKYRYLADAARFETTIFVSLPIYMFTCVRINETHRLQSTIALDSERNAQHILRLFRFLDSNMVTCRGHIFCCTEPKTSHGLCGQITVTPSGRNDFIKTLSTKHATDIIGERRGRTSDRATGLKNRFESPTVVRYFISISSIIVHDDVIGKNLAQDI